MTTAKQDGGYGAAGPIARVKSWWRTEKERQELAALPDFVFDGIQKETGLTRYDAQHMMADHPGPDHLMPQRLAAAGFDAARVAAEQPLLYRDMKTTCAKCDSYKKCDRELHAGGVAEGKWGYCLNNGNIEALEAAEKSCCKG